VTSKGTCWHKRIDCSKTVRLPWTEARARFTTLFERLVIDVLTMGRPLAEETDIRGATRILRISWDEAWHILDRAVERRQRAKRPRVTPLLGVDEKAIAKGAPVPHARRRPGPVDRRIDRGGLQEPGAGTGELPTVGLDAGSGEKPPLKTKGVNMGH